MTVLIKLEAASSCRKEVLTVKRDARTAIVVLLKKEWRATR
jgi:hypothetical protein